MRFAYQQLYAPARLLPRLALDGVSRVPVRRSAPGLYRGGALRAEPYVAWSAGRLYVTAVRLANTSSRTVIIDPRELRGRWLARALLYTELRPRGDIYGRDQGFVVLISPQPFQDTRR